MASDEVGGDEVTRRAAVEKYDGGLTCNNTIELEKLPGRVIQLVDLRVMRVM